MVSDDNNQKPPHSGKEDGPPLPPEKPAGGGNQNDVQDAKMQAQEIPAVGDTSKKGSIGLILIVIVGGILLYNIFLGGEEEKKPPPKSETEATDKGNVSTKRTSVESERQQTDTTQTQAIIEPPPPPPPPDVPAVPPPPVPPTPTPQVQRRPTPMPSTRDRGSSLPGLSPFVPRESRESSGTRVSRLPPIGGDRGAPAINPEEQERLRVNSLIGGGGGAFGPGSSNAKEKNDGAFDPGDSSAPNVEVTQVKFLNRTILQGKMMDAVLETAINSDLPGVLRAVTSRDVYAEKGREILIPKGSRLIGSYNTDIARGQARVYIIWNRVIRPDGIDIALDSPATDQMGRSGIPGVVDNKYLEIFSNSLLLSTVTVGFAAATEALTGSDNIEQGETGAGNATTTGGVTDIATLEAVENFSNTAGQVVEDLINVDPTVTIDQGVLLKVFVNRDIMFPTDLEKNAMVYMHDE